MMNKSHEQIRSECQDRVDSLGKFEGENIYAPYFYDAMLLGEGEILEDENGDEFVAFTINETDMEIFPELEWYGYSEGGWIRFFESSDGFWMEW